MKKYFIMDRNTGLITSKVTFDREKRDEYVVLLKVSDGGGKFGFASLKVLIHDANDNAPYFPLKEYKMVISSSSKPNKTILTVRAKDNDISENGAINYRIVQNSIDKKLKDTLEINEKNGNIRLNPNVGFYETGLYQFFVRAHDSGEPQFHTDVPVSVEIIDTDVTIPTFEKASVLLKIIESTPPGTVLTKLHIMGNFTFKFTILEEQGHFIISDSGELILQQTLDREQQESHHLIVVAETATVPALFAYSSIVIHVRDENDNYPKFDNTFYSVSVPENSDRVISLVKITATDADTGPNGDIRYYLENDLDSIQNIFDIDIYTGWITLLTSLDREVQSEFNFKTTAIQSMMQKCR
ncbi:GL16046 [Drosophila persimilis]|uniref:GL16046 n=1 Tax=Drosophila persimilis TaxID=7234 RepID=B4HDM4_DROPE|nr:GL16046 [Drosophila persimilis]